MTKLTKHQIKKFIKIRNESMFNSNLQFKIDAGRCHFSTTELGPVEQTDDGGWRWKIPGIGILEEKYNKLELIENE